VEPSHRGAIERAAGHEGPVGRLVREHDVEREQERPRVLAGDERGDLADGAHPGPWHHRTRLLSILALTSRGARRYLSAHAPVRPTVSPEPPGPARRAGPAGGARGLRRHHRAARGAG